MPKCKKDDKWCNLKQSQFGTKGPTTAKKVAKELNKIKHTKYVEPLVGKGNVFRAKLPVEKEIINDINCKHLSIVKEKMCGGKDKDKCERFKEAKKSCGDDYKKFLERNDSKDTLIYLDPPFLKEGGKVDENLHFKDKDVSLDEIIEKTKDLDSKVAISYADKPEFRKKLCQEPFKCKKIKKQLFNIEYSEILAIKDD